MSPINGAVSHWFAEEPPPRPALPGDRDADVCIVGAGYTGLWTAYYLKKADPSLRISVLEARFAGFGASGRNGEPAVIAWQQALNDSVDEVIAVAAAEGIDAGIVKGGTLHVARNRAQASRLSVEVDEELAWKVDGITRLSKAQVAERIQLDGVVSGYHTPHCARIQPARLARGLAEAVQRLGVDIYEQTPAVAIDTGRVRTPHGVVRAPIVLRATEGFTATLPGLRRRWLPMNSSMIVTEPLPPQRWAAIGWQDRATLGDTAHGFFYAQRTVDDRIAIGGRSVPYRFGSRIDRDGRVPPRTIGHLSRVLHSLLPQIRDIPIAHGWCGVLAVPRDWQATVAFDARTGSGWAGGYVGHGVTATNLAGRTLTDLVLDRRSALTDLPWVGHRSRTWEPEPLRWLGVRGMYLAYKAADWHESRGRTTTSPIAVLADKIAGRPH
ncbi:FAD-dependent oxidoreductase [Mycolicibacterium flavescens]|uniref:FAD-dependent oxidoreductase n=1 Tax=Mycolicibacterium flavescens TaxID=1776 RepID=A0A1E3RF41_MYCFV|nr:FAD-dependent oxidoreductase [Mycolicibacterium flavescens]MCV7278727.1 FAD-dependent oxidoreductase [Mycolicibacterium flavescens]ODQ88474.1 FAD-dependent oxidoreductase [Mycolicibacterium flavescens]